MKITMTILSENSGKFAEMLIENGLKYDYGFHKDFVEHKITGSKRNIQVFKYKWDEFLLEQELKTRNPFLEFERKKRLAA